MNEQELKACCAHQRVVYRPTGGNAMGWTDRWVCDQCSKEFVPEAHLRHLRETASGVIDALSHQGSATFEKAWDELCFLCGRHCEPYLSVKPPIRCRECGGDGKTAQAESRTCPECNGSGVGHV